jgi:hypothetical protein
MRIAPLVALLAIAGCSTYWDPHAPKTVLAKEDGGAVSVHHGDRLHLPLASEDGYEWRLVEPPVRMVLAEGPPAEQGIDFTPVRTGAEQLRLEYRPIAVEGPAQRSVSYDVTVLNPSGVWTWVRSLFTRK